LSASEPRAPAQEERSGDAKFSVVIAAYNASATLAETIESVLAQTRADFEVIVVDDGSIDDTAQIAASFATDGRVKVIEQENGGPSRARNRGIAAASGEFVSTLDSDDLWLPNYLAEMGRALEESPQAGFAYTDAWIYHEPSGRFREATVALQEDHPPAPTLPREELLQALLKHNFVHNSVTSRRAVLEQVGGYDPNLSFGEDYELWLRMLISGFPAVRVPGQLAVFRDHLGSLSKDLTAMAAAPSTVFSTLLARDIGSAEVRALLEVRLEDTLRLVNPTPAMRARRWVRRPMGALTRRLRTHYLPSRWRLRSTPPADVARALPQLAGPRSPAGGGGEKSRSRDAPV
jgi:GT2 family glycosyltransferase